LYTVHGVDIMKNKMKQNLSDSDIQKIFSSNNLGNVLDSKQLSGGEFNTVYKVVTDNGEYVIKIAPSKDVSVLTYEQNIAASEQFALNKLCNNSYAKVPKVIAFSASTNKYSYLIIEFVEGKMLLGQKLSKDEYNNVMFNLGKAVAEFHNVECDLGFGYLQNGLKSTWKEAYFDMVQNIIADAKKVRCKIPYFDEIMNMIDKCSYVLDEVKTPSILHFDLWQGNIFIKDGKLSSIIDFERTILGDPVGDFIHLDYIVPFNLDENKSLIDGYNSVAKNKLSFNKNELIRFYLMRLYLGMIAYVETYYRMPRFSAQFFGKKVFARKVLSSAVHELNKLTKEE
ncbi:MAG: aminoglycoside phosphotransferase family protein, partial [Eubacterium sp.]|nr:aminoglycoside phosphotransferase family protein [Eubacterium sp.]